MSLKNFFLLAVLGSCAESCLCAGVFSYFKCLFACLGDLCLYFFRWRSHYTSVYFQFTLLLLFQQGSSL